MIFISNKIKNKKEVNNEKRRIYENASNNKITLLTISIILGLIIIGLLTYKIFIYDKDNNLNNNNPKLILANDNENFLYVSFESKLHKLHYPNDNSIVGSIIVDNKGDTYYVKNAEFKNESDLNKLGEKTKYLFERTNEEIDVYKMDFSNIREVNAYLVGNGGTLVDFVLVSKDNKASIIRINFEYSSNPMTITSVNIYKNIAVDIITSKEVSGMYHLIDKNNKEYIFKLN